jgi:hypothetical protein
MFTDEINRLSADARHNAWLTTMSGLRPAAQRPVSAGPTPDGKNRREIRAAYR